jgi:hypothetical protein
MNKEQITDLVQSEIDKKINELLKGVELEDIIRNLNEEDYGDRIELREYFEANILN